MDLCSVWDIISGIFKASHSFIELKVDTDDYRQTSYQLLWNVLRVDDRIILDVDFAVSVF